MTLMLPKDLQNAIQNFYNKEEQIQQAGFDLTVQSIARFISEGTLTIDNGDRKISDTEEVPLDHGFFSLIPGGYVLRYNESVHVPKNAAGLTLPRSSLMRSGATIHSALWDPGYEGVGMGLLTVTNPLRIEKNARVAQIIFFELNDRTEGYNGVYQKEGL